MPSPAIVNVAELLAPIDGDDPAGVPMEYMVEQALDTARKDFEQRPEGRVPKKPDWDEVIKIARDELEGKSKDLRLATRLVEGLAQQHGMAGLRDGLELVAAMMAECWERMHPVPDEDDEDEGMEIRAELLSGALSDPEVGFVFPLTVRKLPLVRVDDDVYSLLDKQQADKGRGPIPLESFARAQPLTDTIFEDVKLAIAELEKLNQTLDEKLQDQAPNLMKLEEALEECRMFLQHIIGEPEEETDDEESVAVDGEAPAPKAASPNAITTREDAYRQLAKIAQVLEKVEPHSPIPDLLRRAVELGKMPFRDLIRQIIRDEGMLHEVNREFGIKEEEEAE